MDQLDPCLVFDKAAFETEFDERDFISDNEINKGAYATVYALKSKIDWGTWALKVQTFSSNDMNFDMNMI